MPFRFDMFTRVNFRQSGGLNHQKFNLHGWRHRWESGLIRFDQQSPSQDRNANWQRTICNGLQSTKLFQEENNWGFVWRTPKFGVRNIQPEPLSAGQNICVNSDFHQCVPWSASFIEKKVPWIGTRRTVLTRQRAQDVVLANEDLHAKDVISLVILATAVLANALLGHYFLGNCSFVQCMEVDTPLSVLWEQGGSCSICQNVLMQPLVCCGISNVSKHEFHLSCIHSAVAVDSRCPICRLDWGVPACDDRSAWVLNGTETTPFKLDESRRPVLHSDDEFEFVEEVSNSGNPNQQIDASSDAEAWVPMPIPPLIEHELLEEWHETVTIIEENGSIQADLIRERQLDFDDTPANTQPILGNQRIRSPWQLQDVDANSTISNFSSRSRSRTMSRNLVANWHVSDEVINPFPSPAVRSMPRNMPESLMGTMMLEPSYNRRSSIPQLQSWQQRPTTAMGQDRSPWQITSIGEPITPPSEYQPSSMNGSRASASEKATKWAANWIQSMNGLNFQGNSLLRAFTHQKDRQIELLGDLFRGCAPSTLSKHYGPWSKWKEFATRVNLQPIQPTASDIIIYMDGFKDRPGLRAFRSCLNFLCFKIKFDGLCEALTVLKEVFTCRLLQMQKPTKEAPPWSLFSATELELALMASQERLEICQLGAALATPHGGLRFSDIQRVEVSELCIDSSTLRGFVFKSKTRRLGFPFGFLKCGITGRNWVEKWYAVLNKFMAGKDYLFPANSQFDMGTYSQFRSTISRILGQSAVVSYTGHSGKVTLLAWACQLSLSDNERRSQGHHKASNGNNMVVLYGRDDVSPQLHLQCRILLAIQAGWRPQRSLNRGGRLGLELAVDASKWRQLPTYVTQMLPDSWTFSMITPVLAELNAIESVVAEEIQPQLADQRSTKSDSGSSNSSDTSNSSSDDSDSEIKVQRPTIQRSDNQAIFLGSSRRGIVHIGIRRGSEQFLPACGSSRVADLTEVSELEIINFSRCRHAACLSRF